jgi:hypothetical protein
MVQDLPGGRTVVSADIIKKGTSSELQSIWYAAGRIRISTTHTGFGRITVASPLRRGIVKETMGAFGERRCMRP